MNWQRVNDWLSGFVMGALVMVLVVAYLTGRLR